MEGYDSADWTLSKILTTENYVTSSRCINLHDNLLPLILTVDCGNLTDPANGKVDHSAGTTVGQTATYSCNTGYNLVGDSTRTCQASGNWSGSAHTCAGIQAYTQKHVNMYLALAYLVELQLYGRV